MYRPHRNLLTLKNFSDFYIDCHWKEKKDNEKTKQNKTCVRYFLPTQEINNSYFLFYNVISLIIVHLNNTLPPLI